MITTLKEKYPLGIPIQGEEAQRLIRLFGAILRVRNILGAFDEFEGNEILTERDYQDYQSAYIDLYQEYRPRIDADKEDINDDIEFEIELIKQIEVNIDYILMLVAKYQNLTALIRVSSQPLIKPLAPVLNSQTESLSKDLLNRSTYLPMWRKIGVLCTGTKGFIRNN